MLQASLWIESGLTGKVTCIQKDIDLGSEIRNWEVLKSFMLNDRVLCGEVFDDVNHRLYEWKYSERLQRIDWDSVQ